VFILGTTGVGKSKLALDLAARLSGELVNADSMQVYAGNAGVMTAKPTAEEQSTARHHGYSRVPPTQADFNVNKYRQMAMEAIDDI
jgi:tRNA dimethylallyltransferase